MSFEIKGRAGWVGVGGVALYTYQIKKESWEQDKSTLRITKNLELSTLYVVTQ